MKNLTLLPFATVLALSCGGGLEDGRNPTGSQALVTSSDFSALYVANAAEDRLTRVDLSDRTTTEIPLEGEPSRIARAGGRVVVSLRSARQLAVFREAGGTLEETGRIDVGAEPFGVVAREDGSFFYAASSTSDLVQEFDAATLEPTRAWEVPGQPRWLALHPSGRTLYVAATFGGGVFWIDLDSGRSARVALPEAMTFDVQTGAGVPMSVRVTGDLAVAPDGEDLAIPVLYLDDETPIAEEAEEETDPGYTGRVNPAVAMIPVDGEGRPESAGEAVLVRDFDVSSYPSSVGFTPDSELAVATLEGSGVAAVFPVDFETNGDEVPVSPFPFVPVELIGTDAGPTSIAFTADDEAYVYAFLDRTVATMDLAPVRTWLSGSFASDGPIRFAGDGTVVSFSSQTQDSVVVAASTLPPEVERGRRLFYAANDARMAEPGAGVSCATCHFDGRTDGVTWPFERGPRQTPSLAGLVSARAPVRWEGDKETVAVDAMSTSQGLMRGQGLTIADAQDIEAFVDWTRAVDLPLKGTNDPAIDRGRAIFERPEVGCASCHSGALYSDGQKHDLLGFAGVKTPSLLGVAATGPYFHDGSAPTLRDVVLRGRDGSMGYTADLTETEIDDLVRFLRSL